MDSCIKVGHFIRYLGSLGGTLSGGLAAMYRSLLAVQSLPVSEPVRLPEDEAEKIAAAACAIEAPQGTSGEGLQQELAVMPAGACKTQGKRAQGEKSSFLKALGQQIEALHQMEHRFSDDDFRWPRAEMVVKQTSFELKKLLAEESTECRQKSAPMAVNPLAPPGESMKRLMQAEERGRNRGQAQPRQLLSAEFPEKLTVPVPPANSTQDCERAETFPKPNRQKGKAIPQAAITEQTQHQRRKAMALRKQAERKLQRQVDWLHRESLQNHVARHSLRLP